MVNKTRGFSQSINFPHDFICSFYLNSTRDLSLNSFILNIINSQMVSNLNSKEINRALLSLIFRYATIFVKCCDFCPPQVSQEVSQGDREKTGTFTTKPYRRKEARPEPKVGRQIYNLKEINLSNEVRRHFLMFVFLTTSRGKLLHLIKRHLIPLILP